MTLLAVVVLPNVEQVGVEMQAVGEARGVSCPVWRHDVLLQPGSGVRLAHCKPDSTMRICSH